MLFAVIQIVYRTGVPAGPKNFSKLVWIWSPGEQGFKGDELLKQYQEMCVHS